LFVSGSEEGTGDPGWIRGGVVFGGSDDCRDVAGCVSKEVLMLLARRPGSNRSMINKTIGNDNYKGK